VFLFRSLRKVVFAARVSGYSASIRCQPAEMRRHHRASCIPCGAETTNAPPYRDGTEMVRLELRLPEARVRVADPKLWFSPNPSPLADSKAGFHAACYVVGQ
jgi:hypothetical protein